MAEWIGGLVLALLWAAVRFVVCVLLWVVL